MSLLPHSVARVNSALMLSADTPLTAAAVAGAAGIAYTPAVSAIATLEKRGLVRRTHRAGKDVFEPNRSSVYYPMAHATALVDLPLAAAVRGEPVYAIYAYGSLARPGGGTRESDLDLLVVGDITDRAGLVERLQVAGTRLNRVIDPLILTPEEFELGKARGDRHLIAALDGIRLLGEA